MKWFEKWVQSPLNQRRVCFGDSEIRLGQERLVSHRCQINCEGEEEIQGDFVSTGPDKREAIDAGKALERERKAGSFCFHIRHRGRGSSSPHEVPGP